MKNIILNKMLLVVVLLVAGCFGSAILLGPGAGAISWYGPDASEYMDDGQSPNGPLPSGVSVVSTNPAPRYVVVNSGNTGNLSSIEIPIYIRSVDKPSLVAFKIYNTDGATGTDVKISAKSYGVYKTIRDGISGTNGEFNLVSDIRTTDNFEYNEDTQLYRATLKFELKYATGYSSSHVPELSSLNRFLFMIELPNNHDNGLVGNSLGASSGSFNTIASDNSPEYYNYAIPFATPCNMNTANKIGISLTDLDSGTADNGGKTITVKVRDVTENRWVFTSTLSDNWETSGSMGDKGTFTVKFYPKSSHKYLLKISQVVPTNILQYHFDIDGASYATGCISTLNPSVAISPITGLRAGSALTVSPTVNNSGNIPVPGAKWALERLIFSPNTAPGTTGYQDAVGTSCSYYGADLKSCTRLGGDLAGISTFTIGNNNVPYASGDTIPSDTAAGSKVCYALSVNPVSITGRPEEKNNNWNHSDLNCVTVAAPNRWQVNSSVTVSTDATNWTSNTLEVVPGQKVYWQHDIVNGTAVNIPGNITYYSVHDGVEDSLASVAIPNQGDSHRTTAPSGGYTVTTNDIGKTLCRKTKAVPGNNIDSNPAVSGDVCVRVIAVEPKVEVSVDGGGWQSGGDVKALPGQTLRWKYVVKNISEGTISQSVPYAGYKRVGILAENVTGEPPLVATITAAGASSPDVIITDLPLGYTVGIKDCHYTLALLNGIGFGSAVETCVTVQQPDWAATAKVDARVATGTNITTGWSNTFEAVPGQTIYWRHGVSNQGTTQIPVSIGYSAMVYKDGARYSPLNTDYIYLGSASITQSNDSSSMTTYPQNGLTLSAGDVGHTFCGETKATPGNINNIDAKSSWACVRVVAVAPLVEVSVDGAIWQSGMNVQAKVGQTLQWRYSIQNVSGGTISQSIPYSGTRFTKSDITLGTTLFDAAAITDNGAKVASVVTEPRALTFSDVGGIDFCGMAGFSINGGFFGSTRTCVDVVNSWSMGASAEIRVKPYGATEWGPWRTGTVDVQPDDKIEWQHTAKNIGPDAVPPDINTAYGWGAVYFGSPVTDGAWLNINAPTHAVDASSTASSPEYTVKPEDLRPDMQAPELCRYTVVIPKSGSSALSESVRSSPLTCANVIPYSDWRVTPSVQLRIVTSPASEWQTGTINVRPNQVVEWKHTIKNEGPNRIPVRIRHSYGMIDGGNFSGGGDFNGGAGVDISNPGTSNVQYSGSYTVTDGDIQKGTLCRNTIATPGAIDNPLSATSPFGQACAHVVPWSITPSVQIRVEGGAWQNGVVDVIPGQSVEWRYAISNTSDYTMPGPVYYYWGARNNGKNVGSANQLGTIGSDGVIPARFNTDPITYIVSDPYSFSTADINQGNFCRFTAAWGQMLPGVESEELACAKIIQWPIVPKTQISTDGGVTWSDNNQTAVLGQTIQWRHSVVNPTDVPIPAPTYNAWGLTNWRGVNRLEPLFDQLNLFVDPPLEIINPIPPHTETAIGFSGPYKIEIADDGNRLCRYTIVALDVWSFYPSNPADTSVCAYIESKWNVDAKTEVSVDGGNTWQSADVQAFLGDVIKWRHTVTNHGNNTTTDVKYYNLEDRELGTLNTGTADGQSDVKEIARLPVQDGERNTKICQLTTAKPGSSAVGSSSAVSPKVCVKIDYSYNLRPEIIGDYSSKVFEPDSQIAVDAAVNNEKYGDTPGPTTSAPTEYRISQVVIPQGTAKPTTLELDSSSDPSVVYGEYGIFSDIATRTGYEFPYGVTNIGATPNIGSFNIGTKICYGLSVKDKSSDANSGWRHSALKCATIGKKPKIQVLGGDLWSGGTISASTSLKDNRSFGSWIEYGVFAKGAVRGIGSGAAYSGPVGLEQSSNYCNYSVLTFTNFNCSGRDLGNYTNNREMKNVAERLVASFPGGTTLGPTIVPREMNSGTYTADNLTIHASELPVGIDGGKSIIIKASGTVTIDGNQTYANGSYTAIKNLPQLIIIANKIVINSNVTNVDAWLIAKGEEGIIETCNTLSSSYELAAGDRLTDTKCNQKLTVNGIVLAKKLWLRRTAGAGATDAAGIHLGDPAEVFNLRADAYLWSAARAGIDGRIQTVYTRELPPRF